MNTKRDWVMEAGYNNDVNYTEILLKEFNSELFQNLMKKYSVQDGEGETKANQLFTALSNILCQFLYNGATLKNAGAFSIRSNITWIKKYTPFASGIEVLRQSCSNNSFALGLILLLQSITFNKANIEKFANKKIVNTIF